MIRDPSDGSVREVQSDTEQAASGLRSTSAVPVASGLPTPSGKPENLARLEKSREWIRNYHASRVNSEAVTTEKEN